MALPCILTAIACGLGRGAVQAGTQYGFQRTWSPQSRASRQHLFVLQWVQPQPKHPRGRLAEFALNARGNAAPERIVDGPATTLNYPADMAFDRSGNIYVADNGSRGYSGQQVIHPHIAVFSPTARGDVAPTRLITGAQTTLDNTLMGGIAVDSQGDIYVSDALYCKVDIFSSSANGDVPPSATLVAPGCSSLFIAFDQNFDLFDQVGLVIYEFAPGATGKPKPIGRISLPWGHVLDMTIDGSTLYTVFSPHAGPNQVRLYSLPSLQVSFTLPWTLPGYPNSATADAAGNVYVIDIVRGQRPSVIVFPPGSTTPSGMLTGQSTGFRYYPIVRIGP